MSKLEAGFLQLNPEEFDLSQAFEETAITLRLKCTSSKVKLTAHNPYRKCMVNLDKNRLIQVLLNFMTNAIKYTPEGDITMGYEYENNGIKIYVKDTGIGIPADKIDKVFERFVKLNSFIKGTGLGLAICRVIVERLGGVIGVESKEGEGSRFWFRIPRSEKIEK